MSVNHNHNHEKQGKNLVISIFLNLLITVAQVVGHYEMSLIMDNI